MEHYTTVLTEEQIAKRVKELGAQITKDYNGQEIIVVCMLKGAVYFFADLTKNIKCPIQVDFARLSSYRNGTVSGKMEVISEITTNITGKDVLIVEDIIDTGLTMAQMLEDLKRFEPKQVIVVSLFSKKSRRTVDVQIDYSCFDIPSGIPVLYSCFPLLIP